MAELERKLKVGGVDLKCTCSNCLCRSLVLVTIGLTIPSSSANFNSIRAEETVKLKELT